ncbi:MAG: metal-dependent transcriptional regulator [Deltaproteobacteria bacterium]|nr:metal-dependent transcriptional regulator [Deltaproteobacteria bacterium]
MMNIIMASFTGSLKSLERKGLINYTPYSFITLTPNGLKIAREIAQRHSTLKDFLFKVLQVDPDTAEATACRMEHAIDAKSLERLTRFIDYIHTCPRTGQEWLESFINYCSSGAHNREKCDQCLEDCNIRYQESKLPPA